MTDYLMNPETFGLPGPVAGGGSDGTAGAMPGMGGSDDSPRVDYTLRVNGLDRPVNGAWIGESLLYVLRERLGLAGAKDGCDQGECGACSVQLDGQLTAACLVPAALAADSEIRTVEGLAGDGIASDVQRALAVSGAVQCGYCIPGMAMAVHDLLERNHQPTELQAREALCGNLCRCTGYRGALAAVQAVAQARAEEAEAAGTEEFEEAADADRDDSSEAGAEADAESDPQTVSAPGGDTGYESDPAAETGRGAGQDDRQDQYAAQDAEAAEAELPVYLEHPGQQQQHQPHEGHQGQPQGEYAGPGPAEQQSEAPQQQAEHDPLFGPIEELAVEPAATGFPGTPYETPAFGTPPFGTPAFGTPAFDAAAFEAHAFEPQAFETAQFETPQFEAPAFEGDHPEPSPESAQGYPSPQGEEAAPESGYTAYTQGATAYAAAQGEHPPSTAPGYPQGEYQHGEYHQEEYQQGEYRVEEYGHPEEHRAEFPQQAPDFPQQGSEYAQHPEYRPDLDQPHLGQYQPDQYRSEHYQEQPVHYQDQQHYQEQHHQSGGGQEAQPDYPSGQFAQVGYAQQPEYRQQHAEYQGSGYEPSEYQQLDYPQGEYPQPEYPQHGYPQGEYPPGQYPSGYSEPEASGAEAEPGVYVDPHQPRQPSQQQPHQSQHQPAPEA